VTFAELVNDARRRRPRSEMIVALLRQVDSTNALARRVRAEMAADDLPLPWTALVAYEQTAGRGRLGRNWSSPAGEGIYATLLGRLPTADRLSVLPLATGVALAEVLDRHLPVPCRLKWPNDLLIKGRKVGGVLVESTVRGEQPEVIVGFGINYSVGQRELPTPAATSLLLETEDLPPLSTLWCDCLEAVAAEVRSNVAREMVVQRWLLRSMHSPGDSLRCRLGDREVSGKFAGLTRDGLLRLAVDGREEVLVSAEVTEA